MKIYRKNREELTAYGLACGYILEDNFYRQKENESGYANFVMLGREHNCYYISAELAGVKIYFSFHTWEEQALKKAYKAYYTLKKYKKALDFTRQKYGKYGEKRDFKKISVTNGQFEAVTTWSCNTKEALKMILLDELQQAKEQNKEFKNLKCNASYY